MADRSPQTADPVVATAAAGSLALLAATAAALVWANTPWRGSYGRLFSAPVHTFVDQGLMTLFFLAVGLEIRRELSHWKEAVLPAVAALGGMLVPALVYLALNLGRPGRRGWGIPMATDIGFAVGALALLGPRIPRSLRVFLLTLAVVDDIGAIVVIACFYSRHVRIAGLVAAAVLVVALALVARVRPRWLAVHVLAGALLWAALHTAGVHPTLAGAAVGLLTPGHERVESVLARLVAFAILPVFALANAGLTITGSTLRAPGASAVALGVVLGLVVGKTLGITATTWAAARTGLGRLPEGVTWTHVAGIASLGGIGFTVSLFVAGVAFADPRLETAAKLGVLAASVLAATVGLAVLSRVPRDG